MFLFFLIKKIVMKNKAHQELNFEINNTIIKKYKIKKKVKADNSPNIFLNLFNYNILKNSENLHKLFL